jgi:hypothetical protein
MQHACTPLTITETEKELLDQPWAAFLRDPATALSLEQFKERIKAPRP